MGSNFSAETLAAWHGELMHASLASGSQKTLVTAGELLLPFSRECFTSIICHVASDAAVAGAMSGVPHLRDRLRLLVESISSITMRLAMVRSQSDWCRLAPHLRRYLDLARSTAEKLEHQTTEAHRGAYFWLIWSMICGGGSAITNTPPPFTMADLLAPKRLVCCCGSRRGRRCYSAEILSILVGLADLRWNDILTMLNGHVVQRYRRHCTTVANATNTQPGVQDGNAVLTMQCSILQHIIRFNSCPNMLEALIGSRSPPAVYEAVLQRSLQTVPGIAEHGVAMTFHPTEDILMLLGKSRVPLPLRLKDRQVIYSESTDVALYALGNRNPANWQMSAEMTSRFLRVQNLLHAELNAHIPVSGLTDIVLDYMTDR
jgi:hypothetical protein